MPSGSSPRSSCSRPAATTCGTFAADELALTDEQAMVDCILAASAAGTPRELDFLRPGTGCCAHLTRCGGVALTGEPFGFPEATACDEPVML